MTQVAVVGANGQVGTEVVLRLAGVPGVQVVPVVRNRSGSAFLRSVGVECRHGSLTDPASARDLLSDCDVIVNLAHVESYIARQRAVNTVLQDCLTDAAAPGARLVLASTIMVYAPNLPLRWPDTYGSEKLLLERRARKWARASGNDLIVLRLGHVLGDLQAISRKIVGELASGSVPMIKQGRTVSNAVFAASLAETIVRVGHGEVPAGTYDLVNDPQWTWADVYAHYARQTGLPFTVMSADSQAPPVARMVRTATGAAVGVLLRPRVRVRLAFFMRWLPEGPNERLYVAYQVRRATREIAALTPASPSVIENWRPVGGRTLPLEPPLHALDQYPLPASLVLRQPLEHDEAHP
jgi:nucleoside-diphosphate-sugar epimerase